MLGAFLFLWETCDFGVLKKIKIVLGLVSHMNGIGNLLSSFIF
jgi:hypothetical protein